jgi:nitronate monooxygenase
MTMTDPSMTDPSMTQSGTTGMATSGPRGALARARDFCDRFGLSMPVLLAPMAGNCPPSLSIAVQKAGGMGAAGVVQSTPREILTWARQVRAESSGPFQLNIWIPDPPVVDADRASDARRFPRTLGDPGEPAAPAPDFAAQCEAMLAARPALVSSIMGLFPAEYVRRAAGSRSGCSPCSPGWPTG